MKVNVWVTMNLVGCRQETEVEIPDEDLESLSDSDREVLIEKFCKDEIDNIMEWGWTYSIVDSVEN